MTHCRHAHSSHSLDAIADHLVPLRTLLGKRMMRRDNANVSGITTPSAAKHAYTMSSLALSNHLQSRTGCYGSSGGEKSIFSSSKPWSVKAPSTAQCSLKSAVHHSGYDGNERSTRASSGKSLKFPFVWSGYRRLNGHACTLNLPLDHTPKLISN